MVRHADMSALHSNFNGCYGPCLMWCRGERCEAKAGRPGSGCLLGKARNSG